MSERFLVVCQAWVGDVVMAQSLLKLLKQRNPDAEIDVLAPEFHGQVIRRMPEVTNFVPAAGGHGKLALLDQVRLGRSLRHRRYTRAIVLPRSVKSALVPFIAGAAVRTGFLGEHRRMLLNDIREGRDSLSTVDGFIALGLRAGEAPPPSPPQPRLEVDVRNQARLRERIGLAPGEPVAALAPGAEFGPAKQWPVEHFAQTARALAASGRRVLVLGSPKEFETGAAVAGAGPGIVNLCGDSSLEDAIDLLGMAQVAVTNDSGLMHIAAAVGTHVVALYGSTSPEKAYAITSRKDVFWLALPCSPCRQRTCPLGHLECLRLILPTDVIAAALAAAEAS